MLGRPRARARRAPGSRAEACRGPASRWALAPRPRGGCSRTAASGGSKPGRLLRPVLDAECRQSIQDRGRLARLCLLLRLWRRPAVALRGDSALNASRRLAFDLTGRALATERSSICWATMSLIGERLLTLVCACETFETVAGASAAMGGWSHEPTDAALSAFGQAAVALRGSNSFLEGGGSADGRSPACDVLRPAAAAGASSPPASPPLGASGTAACR